jgi:hypothetical protein
VDRICRLDPGQWLSDEIINAAVVLMMVSTPCQSCFVELDMQVFNVSAEA